MGIGRPGLRSVGREWRTQLQIMRRLKLTREHRYGERSAARIGFPGLAAVTFPLSTTTWPPTMTKGMPADGIAASSYVERSITV